jgi:hypothetical protein
LQLISLLPPDLNLCTHAHRYKSSLTSLFFQGE